MSRIPGMRTKAGRRYVLGLAVLAILVLGVTGGALYSIYHSTAASAGVARTVTVQRGVVQESVSASGNVSPVTAENVNFATGGTVTAVDVTAGERVTAGQVLATLDPSQATVTLQAAEASLQQAQATLSADEAGGTSSQLAQNQVSISQAESQLTTDEQTLTSDETTLSQAERQLSADEALGCPPSSGSPASASSTGSGSGGSGSGSGSGGSGSGSGSGGSGSGGSGSSHAAATDAVTAPAVTTGAASSLMTTTAQLNGTVDPDGATTTYWFQYGTTTGYGETTTNASIAAGPSPVSVSAGLTGLSPGTSYIFRLVATNAEGTTEGPAQFLTTAQSSCVVDQQTVTTDQQAVQRQQATVSQQQASITATEDGQAPQAGTVAAAEASVAQAQLTVQTDQKALAETTLRAPISGTITALNGEVGESVSGSASSAASTGSSSASSTAGGGGGGGGSGSGSSSSSSSSSSAFLTIESLGDLEVVVPFPEADAVNVAVGQPATVTLSALASTEVGGTVTAVSDLPTVSSNVVYYDETILLHNPPATVKDGMTALVSVVVATASNVLEVPSAAITTVGSSSTVTVKNGNTTQVVRVTLGLVGNSTTQIESGVTAGETLVEPTAAVSTGTGTGSTTTGGGGGGRFFGGGGGGLLGGGGLGG